MLAVSKIMGALADKMGILEEEEKEKWVLVGLLHNLDYERTKDNHEKHGIITAEMLKEELGLERKEFFKLALEALQEISDELGL